MRSVPYDSVSASTFAGMTHELQVALLKRAIATVVEEINGEIPLHRVTQMVAIGGDVRLAASQLQEHEDSDGVHEIPSDAFLAFCDEVERLDDDSVVNRFRLPVGGCRNVVAGAADLPRAPLTNLRATGDHLRCLAAGRDAAGLR